MDKSILENRESKKAIEELESTNASLEESNRELQSKVSSAEAAAEEVKRLKVEKEKISKAHEDAEQKLKEVSFLVEHATACVAF